MVLIVFDKATKERVCKLYNVTNIVPRDGYIEITQVFKDFSTVFHTVSLKDYYYVTSPR